MSVNSGNKELVRRLIEDIACRELNRLDDVVAEDFVSHCQWRDREGLRSMLRAWHGAYPLLDR